MSLRLYLDHHVPRAVALGLRLEGIDVVTALEDGSAELADPDLLSRATAQGRVLVSQDDDLLKEAARRQRENIPFYGLVYAHQEHVSIGAFVDDLVLIAQASALSEINDQVQYLPL